MKAFSINIIGLSKKANHFNFEFGDAFFETYAHGLVSGGEFKATVILDKHETFIEAEVEIRGHVRLVCDRSLKPFDQAVNLNKRMVFKYGDQEEELTDEIVVIRRDRATLEMGQYLNEFIVLDLPMKRLHPDFRANEEEDNEEGKMVYRSSPEDVPGEPAIDPRWEQLKKLK